MNAEQRIRDRGSDFDSRPTEERVLAAMVCHDRLRALAIDLEVADFQLLQHRELIKALRNIEARGEIIDSEAIFDEIERTDREFDKHVADSTLHNGLFTRLLTHAEDYPSDVAFIRDGAKLRLIREQLERVDAAAAAAPPEQHGFQRMPVRIGGELAGRLYLAARALHYQIAYLDDCLRVVLPHDLVLLGAPTGLGKTELALAIAMANASRERHVAYFALEAEPLELERRIKFAWLSSLVYRSNHERRHHMNYTDWLLGELEDVCGPFNDQVDQRFLTDLGGLQTFYRGSHFTTEHLCKAILDVHQRCDLIIVDHLHYIDLDGDDSEQRALGDTIKAIRDVSLRVGRPVLLVAHLRKRDPRLKQLIPTLDDFHGSSNITKICTQVITLERASTIEAPKWWLSPTYIAVLKDRRAGANGLVAMTHFDRRTRAYVDHYTLGRLIKGGTEWEPLKAIDAPMWARSNRQLELELGDRRP